MPLIYADKTPYHELPERREIVVRQFSTLNKQVSIDELLELHKLLNKKNFIQNATKNRKT